jgi:hypothetical protein
MSTQYRGYIIEVRTIGSDNSWRALVNIEKHTDELIDGQLKPVTHVSPTDPIPMIFENESQALKSGAVWGQKMVDERLANHSKTV